MNKTEMLAIIIRQHYKKKKGDITIIKNEAKLSYSINWFFEPMDERMNPMKKYLYIQIHKYILLSEKVVAKKRI